MSDGTRRAPASQKPESRQDLPMFGDTRVTPAAKTPENTGAFRGAVVWGTTDRHGDQGHAADRGANRGDQAGMSLDPGYAPGGPAIRHHIAWLDALRFDWTRPAHRAVMWRRACRPRKGVPMTPRIQIVGRLPVELSRRVRAAAKQQRISLNAFLIAALTQALASPPGRRAKRGA
jgi:hypothetical protein